MRRTLLVRLSAAILVMAGAWAAYTQTKGAPRPATIQKVKGDLYMISGEGGNVAVYVTDEGVILVDDMYERNYNQVMDQVKSVTSKPVKYVLNTHHHDDHSGGNGKMDPSIEIIAQRNVRTNMLMLKQAGPPRVTFTNEMDVHLGGKQVIARYYGRGHTNGDSVIYFPEIKVIHSGDLFLTNGTSALPFMDFASGGSALEWTKTLDGMLTIDFDTVIPGHGPLSNRDGVLKWRADFVTMRDRIGSMVHQGRSREEVSKTLVGEFHWPDGGLAIQQVDAFIAELKQ
jgi:cyclase